MVEESPVPWARRADVGFRALEGVQRGLTVESIMTPRARLMTCRRRDSVRELMSRNTGRYSFLPVLDEKDGILGLYRDEQWFGREPPDQPIGADFVPLAEALVVGVDATIIEFLTSAHEQPTKLVVSGHRVAGLVGLSDFQQLPVRAALFTLITSLEIVMADWIEAQWPDDPKSWLALLSPGRRTQVLGKIEYFTSSDSFVAEVLCTEFTDKCTIIRKRASFPASRNQMERDFSAIRELRDRLAHASHYAQSPQEALDVCCVTRRILEFLSWLRNQLDTPRTEFCEC